MFNLSGYNSLLVDIVHSPRGDSTNGGASRLYKKMYVLFPRSDMELQEMRRLRGYHEDSNILVYIFRELWGKPAHYVEPLIYPKDNRVIGPSFGGNMALINGAEIPIMDRFDTVEQYDALSR
jgi:hypothetical protein